MTPDAVRKALASYVAPSLLEVAVGAVMATTPVAAPVAPGVALECGVQGRGDTVCRKTRGHGQRHRYSEVVNPSRHVPLPITWAKVESVAIKSGSKTFTLKVGGPCSLLPGTASGPATVGQIKHGYKVLAIESHPDGRINVEVVKPGDLRARIVPLSRILYKRPKKVTS